MSNQFYIEFSYIGIQILLFGIIGKSGFSKDFINTYLYNKFIILYFLLEIFHHEKLFVNKNVKKRSIFDFLHNINIIHKIFYCLGFIYHQITFTIKFNIGILVYLNFDLYSIFSKNILYIIKSQFNPFSLYLLRLVLIYTI